MRSALGGYVTMPASAANTVTVCALKRSQNYFEVPISMTMLASDDSWKEMICIALQQFIRQAFNAPATQG